MPIISGIVLFLLFAVQNSDELPGNISRKKCLEYAKYVYKDEFSPVLSVNSGKHSVSKCDILEVPLIIGGVKASLNEFPHMAVLGFGATSDPTEKLAWNCGGTLISHDFVLTAAHCMKHRERGECQRVRVGMISLQKNTPHMQEILIKQRIPHPDYSTKSKYNDIALVKLARKVTFNEHVHPACINANMNIAWRQALATGFGRINFDDQDGSVDLMKVRLSNIETKFCQQTYQTMRSMTSGVKPSQFCAGEMAGMRDTCQGDSGGPLQIVLERPYCMYNIIGITSFGKFCGFEKSPGIYTNVAYFIQWIELIVWSKST